MRRRNVFGSIEPNDLPLKQMLKAVHRNALAGAQGAAASSRTPRSMRFSGGHSSRCAPGPRHNGPAPGCPIVLCRPSCERPSPIMNC